RAHRYARSTLAFRVFPGRNTSTTNRWLSIFAVHESRWSHEVHDRRLALQPVGSGLPVQRQSCLLPYPQYPDLFIRVALEGICVNGPGFAARFDAIADFVKDAKEENEGEIHNLFEKVTQAEILIEV